MERLEKYQNFRGGIPGLNNVPWVCSTGMFQLALIYYKLGELKKGDKIFYYACSLQNSSGGWFGSYPSSPLDKLWIIGRRRPFYFRNQEISWANKFFLDALSKKLRLEFDMSAPQFLDSIDEDDGRYETIDAQLKEIMMKRAVSVTGGGGEHNLKLKVADIGCGKGRYLKNLRRHYPDNIYYAIDLSPSVMKDVKANYKIDGSLTRIPFGDNFFDFVYACESFEHAVNMEGAFKELYRVVRPGGRFVIIDKPIEKLGKLKLYEWEAWIDDKQIKKYTALYGGDLTIIPSLKYEGGKDDGLFRAWIVKKIN